MVEGQRHFTTNRGTRMSNAPILMAIAYAAHKSGDKELEKVARRELEREFGIVLRFKQERIRKLKVYEP